MRRTVWISLATICCACSLSACATYGSQTCERTPEGVLHCHTDTTTPFPFPQNR